MMVEPKINDAWMFSFSKDYIPCPVSSTIKRWLNQKE